MRDEYDFLSYRENFNSQKHKSPNYHQIPQETSKIKKTSKDDVIPSDIANDIANGLNITNNNNAYITVKKDLLNNQGIIHSV